MGSVIDLFRRFRKRDELVKQKAIWLTFGLDYEAEKEKQEEIWRHFSGLEGSPQGRGEGGVQFMRHLTRILNVLAPIDSQAKREEAVKKLEELARMAHKYAKRKRLDASVRLKWARIEAYIYQVINSILKEYDAVLIAKKLEELKRIVENELNPKK